jgi:hypothetical protein
LSDREQRVELVRAITEDPTGRYVTGEVLAERAAQRVRDIRDAIADYESLLASATSTETDLQRFIEANPWLLGLDYAAIQARRPGPSGTMDFVLERFDGYYDVLELKSPQDQLVKAPDIASGEGVPPPHEYALSKDLGQALAQAMVYRDRMTRHSHAADELYGLSNARDARLIIVLGRIGGLPEHRRAVLHELNKSLHRIEVVPYDILGKRAAASLDNVEAHLEIAGDSAQSA